MSGLVALGAAAASAFLAEAGLVGTGLPVLIAPFNLVVLSTLALLWLAPVGEALKPLRLDELALPDPSKVVLTLPFWGPWSVCQGPHGGWTHHGPWKEAWDFIVLDEGRKSHRGTGAQLEDYCAFGLPVAAPADGTVVRVENDVPDNPPGQPNELENWGNHVVIDHGHGLYTEISHFQRGSIRVLPGQQIARGQLLGRCGNSGMSCEPHIHIQLQARPEPGSPALATQFHNYQVESPCGLCQVVAPGTPQQGEQVANSPAPPAQSEEVEPLGSAELCKA